MSTQLSIRSGIESVLGKPWLLALALIVLLFATRSQFVADNLHFAPWLRAPDATLAVFFLAGLWIASLPLVGVLMLTAALADQAAFANGVSAWCVTAAYVFLIPTYAVMWYAGRLCRNVNFLSVLGAGTLATALVVSGAIAWVISSGSFFLFSGYFTDMSASEYFGKVLRYVQPYIGWASAYAVGGIAIALFWKALHRQTDDSVAKR